MRTLPKHITKEALHKLYIEESRSCLQMAKLLNVSTAQVSRYLQRFGIPTRAFSTKGLKPRLGAILSEATKEKISKGHIGKKMSPESSEKKREWMLKNNPFRGKIHTEESKANQRMKMFGRKLTPEHRAKVIKTLIPVQEGQTGESNPSWRGGVSRINARIRSTKPYLVWSRAVKERDGYICVECGLHNKSNHADHIAPFSIYPELRFSVDNGRTLCAECHRKTETYGNKSRKNRKLIKK